MAPESSQFERLKLATEFLDGSCYKHTIARESDIRYENWKRIERLGEGAFGVVHKEICAETSNLRAVKQIRKSLAIGCNEVGILAQLRSYPEHFVQLTGWFEDEYDIYLAMEYLPGDLDGLLKERGLCEDDTKRITGQILAGLETLHQSGICHRDLKPGNILVAKWVPLSVKIGDFGVSKRNDGNTEWRTTAGTRPFMAPEIQGLSCEESSAYTTAVDVWSLGCLVYFMMTRALPFPETKHLVNFIKGRVRFPPSTPRTTSIPPAAIQFITSMLQPLPENRPPASKAKFHSWLLISESNDTIWTEITADPRRSTSGAEPSLQVVMASPVGVQRSLVPVRPPDNKRRRGSYARFLREPLERLLEVAAASGDCKQVTEQLRKGARPMGDLSGYTPIYTAAKAGHIPVVKLLLEHGAHLGVDGERGVSALHGAVTGGSLQVVQYLLGIGADKSLRDKNEGYTALLLAARHGHVDNVRYLLESGADISEKKLGKSGRNALHIAAQYNHLEVADLLLERGADLSVRVDDGDTALHLATARGSVDVLKLLVDRGADISARGGGAERWTALLLAARDGHVEIVRYLLQNGVTISAQKLDSSGRSALHLAAQYNHPEIAGLLLVWGADLSANTKKGFKPLHIAARFDSFDVFKLLVDKGADTSVRVRGDEGWTALLLAARHGRVHNVRYLLQSGANITEELDNRGYSALHLAAEYNHTEVAGLLLDSGADLLGSTKKGFKPLHTAAQFGSVDVLKLLIDKGADTSVRGGGNEGWTALLLAARHGHVEIIRYLMDSGDDISAQKLDSSEDSALHLAAEYNHLEVAGLLLNCGADLSANSKMGFTPLHTAARFGSVDVFKLLIGKGADISVRGGGKEGWTALLLAANNGFLGIVRYVLEETADDISAKMLDSGETCLHLAAEQGHLDVVRLLLETGASTASTTDSGDTAVSLATKGGHTDIVRLLNDWSEKGNVAIPLTQLDNLDLSTPPMQEPTPASGGGPGNLILQTPQTQSSPAPDIT